MATSFPHDTRWNSTAILIVALCLFVLCAIPTPNVLADDEKPVSADTVGPPPAVLPDESDKHDSAAPHSGGDSKVKIFDTVEFKRPLSSLPGWLSVLSRNKANPIFTSGRHFNKSVIWDQFREQAKKFQGLELLRFVTKFWNSWPYKEDIVNWGVEDYWAIPAEFLERSGDCEDYAIVKYFTLKELGVPPEDMRIVVVRDTIRNLGHAILVVYMQNDAYVLDNLSNVVLSNTRFRHYSPQYSVNEFGRWAHLKGRQAK
ncbi:MAG: transglutaminase-like cysteine peptidase [Desulfovibrio sp.]|jgi:predicted transglutaminase-like cysteine proteinase|nr:transglutaminase-like cysteine peptidase [Desulfovibrio sp.]